ncbi:hypothetical protein TRFO_12765 [Tritrichomonas foetus]|uniref:RING-type domain-containing protein n=1 Tax=Tritrichomonas foetus TaxID=1144522 RepID=A0A1J4L0K4_9EUKA|nr:hypothetical protein TRFO_12765 [Tritrichomonas foetus]|eukprot:OHT17049.1 hypothetical protein TRFO_12765 [Tritrichomonas foetus]
MAISFTIYSMISLSIFISAVTKAWMETNDICETCIEIITNNSYFVLILNMFLVTIYAFLRQIRVFFLGEFMNSEYQSASSELVKSIVPILFPILYQYAKSEPSLYFQLVPAIMVTYLKELVIIKINSFSLTLNGVTEATHVKLFILNIILFASCFQITVNYYAHPDSSKHYLIGGIASLYISCAIRLLQYMQKHLYFLTDLSNGTDVKSFHTNKIIDLVYSFISIIACVICHLDYVSVDISDRWHLLIDLIKQSTMILHNISDYLKWVGLCKQINTSLESPTDEELENNDICIICRMKMNKNDSKKIPCGHCFHTDCLSIWVGTQQKCPICSSDISTLFKKHLAEKLYLREVQDEIVFEANNNANQNQNRDNNIDDIYQNEIQELIEFEQLLEQHFGEKQFEPEEALNEMQSENVNTTENVNTSENVNNTESVNTTENVNTTKNVNTTEDVNTSEDVNTTENVNTSENIDQNIPNVNPFAFGLNIQQENKPVNQVIQQKEEISKEEILREIELMKKNLENLQKIVEQMS